MNCLTLIAFLALCYLISVNGRNVRLPKRDAMCQIQCRLTLRLYSDKDTHYGDVEEVMGWCKGYYKISKKYKVVMDKKCPKICRDLISKVEKNAALKKALIKVCSKYFIRFLARKVFESYMKAKKSREQTLK
ncbi:hypothetical protein ANCCAN_16348 [Ancylostoma caninum]|uniref:Saposin B-type domain-containing protein n=1 Tax=Ancylostoma caninum TaxID=29170 RepID=A0A368G453_ANCCA|nr:hypothetical protein ANCCAN_16348 [Ancylostoma caninum]